jgi:hypothetical protein
MPGRRFALGAALSLLAVLTFLTVALIVQDGIDARTVVSLIILALIGFGVLGALNQPPDE